MCPPSRPKLFTRPLISTARRKVITRARMAGVQGGLPSSAEHVLRSRGTASSQRDENPLRRRRPLFASSIPCYSRRRLDTRTLPLRLYNSVCTLYVRRSGDPFAIAAAGGARALSSIFCALPILEGFPPVISRSDDERRAPLGARRAAAPRARADFEYKRISGSAAASRAG